MAWRRYWTLALGVAVGLALALYALVLVVDPFDTVWFSPPLDREPISMNARYSFPALARNHGFDSAVFGTSSTRLLDPEILNVALDASFVNLSMNSATPYEQSQLFSVFVRHHPKPKYTIFGIDWFIWCVSDVVKFTPRPFPPWMYDDDRWNDLLHLFNAFTFEQMGRQFGQLTGLRAPKYGKNGFTRFVPPKSEYDLARARASMYGNNPPEIKPVVFPPVTPTPAQRAAWKYETHQLMAEMVDSLPKETIKILLFPPYHQVILPIPGSLNDARLADCKAQMGAILAGKANSHVVDFTIRSDITIRDENFWDPQHYSTDIAGRIPQFISEAIKTRRNRTGYFRYLKPG